MSAKKKAVKRKPREWTRWAIVQNYGEHGDAFHVVGHSKMTKRGMTLAAYAEKGERVIRVRIVEVIP